MVLLAVLELLMIMSGKLLNLEELVRVFSTGSIFKVNFWKVQYVQHNLGPLKRNTSISIT